MAPDRREVIESTCAAIAKAEANGFEGTARALRAVLGEFSAAFDGQRIALQLPGHAIRTLEAGSVSTEAAQTL